MIGMNCKLECLVRRFAFRLLGCEMMPINIKNGDWVNHPGWRHGPVKVIDQNWALRAVAIQLGPKGGIVVWPMRKAIRVTDSPNNMEFSGGDDFAPSDGTQD